MKKLMLIIGIVALFAACKEEVVQVDSKHMGTVDMDQLVFASGLVLSNDSAFNVVDYAGSGTIGSSNGTAGNPLTAQFDAPEGIVFDSNGNMFVADRDNHVIRKITPSGTVSVFAGVVGSTGAQNGALGTAKFNMPIRLAIDNADNLYVADRDNARIRKITPAGVTSTIAGTTAGSGSTQFDWPVDVAVSGDGTKVYVADSKNHRIQKIILSGGIWTTSLLAGGTLGSTNGTGSAAKFNFPSGVALDNSGNIIVADRKNHTIRKVTSAGVVTLLAGDPGLASYSLDAPRLKARMGEPFGVTVANDGCIYIADIEFHTIRRLNAEGFLSTVGGSGTAGAANGEFATFDLPTSIAIDNSGNFYVADVNNNKIRKMVPTDRTLQYTHGWGKSQPHTGVTWYYFHGNRFFLPSTQTNEIQYVNVLDIDLSVNRLDFLQVDTFNKTTVTNLVGAPTTALAALSGTYATYMPSPSGPYKKYASFLRNNNVTYWDSDIFNTNAYWVYHEGMFFVNSDGTMGMEASNMSQYPFSPTLRKYMMSGAPLLIAGSTIIEKPTSTPWSSTTLQQHIRESTASRSIVAIPTTNNHLLLIIIEGKAAGSVYCAPEPNGYGMTTADAAQFIKRYFNAKGALNLDGGGSASMCLKGHGDNGGVTGGLGVISYPAWAGGNCPAAHTRYSNQRNYMQDAIVIYPN